MNRDAEDASPDRERTGRATSWTLALVGVLVLYVLSPAPLKWIYNQTGVDPPDWLRTVYRPLSYAAEKSPAVRKFYKAYGELLGLRSL